MAYKLAMTDDMPLGDQIRLFGRAKLLVGLHGAGLANMVFMAPGSNVLEMGTRRFDCFETLALFKLGLKYASCSSTQFKAVDVLFDDCPKDRLDEVFGRANSGQSRNAGIEGWRPWEFPG